MVRLTAAGLQH